MSSTTRIIQLSRIASQGDLGSVLIRLMIAINDMALAHDALRLWAEEEEHSRKHRERGGKIYFVRLQISHIYEALSIVKEIRDSPALMKAVERSSRRTQAAFEKLAQFIDSDKFEKIMGRIRNNLTFHYDPKTIGRALQALLEKHPTALGSISLGDDPLDWYCEPGDMIVDRAGVRDIFKVPEGVDVREETDRIIMYLHGIVQIFGGFAASLIWENSS
jgi:hypothetical protein